MLKLYQFPRPKYFSNFSPYCLKLETYLKIAQITYENVYALNTSKNPQKLMSYIELCVQVIGDSSFITGKLVTEYGDKVDAWLSCEQKAITLAIQRLLENHLTPIMLYFRWVYPDGW